MIKERVKVIAIASVVSLMLAIGTFTIGRTAITELVGLAVAQTSTLWNNVKDGAAGDGISSGVLAGSPYIYNGLTFDRLRGGLTADGSAATGLLDLGLMGFNGTTWDRIRTTTDNAANPTLGKLAIDPCVVNTGTPSFTNAFVVPMTCRADGSILVEKTSAGSFFAVKHADLTTVSQNYAFGFTSRKISIQTPSTNTQDICVSWTGGTAACPAANTAGNDQLPAGTAILLDDFGVTSISMIAVSGTQTVYVRAWR